MPRTTTCRIDSLVAKVRYDVAAPSQVVGSNLSSRRRKSTRGSQWRVRYQRVHRRDGCLRLVRAHARVMITLIRTSWLPTSTKQAKHCLVLHFPGRESG